MEKFERVCCICGYHMGGLLCEETHNDRDRYAVAEKKNNASCNWIFITKTVKIMLTLLRQGCTIDCTVTGRRRCSADLPQGGLEVPCSFLFKAILLAFLAGSGLLDLFISKSDHL